jgi:leucyl/phenylalanyl-tRNA--protein transferase
MLRARGLGRVLPYRHAEGVGDLPAAATGRHTPRGAVLRSCVGPGVTVYRLGSAILFPDPREAEADGLLAVGGDLRPARLLAAYARGIFPWYEKEPILWYSPDPRMVLLPRELHVARRLRRTLRREVFEIRFDTAFAQVIRSCAEVERPGSQGTWITREMIRAYCQLHELGFAHAAEAWSGGELVGGIYGVSLGSAFFAESMFHRRRDASKAALATLVEQLEAWEFELFDCQLHTQHLERLGAREWPRARYLEALEQALRRPTRRGPWTLPQGEEVA